MLGWFKKKKTKKDTEVSSKQSLEDSSLQEKTPTPDSELTTSSTEKVTQTSSLSDDHELDPPRKDNDSIEATSSSLFQRLSKKLSRTRESLVSQMDLLFLGKKEIDADLLDDLEELLITADIGIQTATELLDYARKKVKRKELADPLSLKKFLKEKLRSYIAQPADNNELVTPDSGPLVIMVVGVNGVGKTTTIGKIAHKFINSGQTVLLAAAVSQLQIWGERNGIDVVSKGTGADPSSVAFDALTQAVEDNYDVVMVDTAGRLHTQTNLMEELKKIRRVIGKKLEGAPHEVLLVIDATTGQNGISQAKLFNEAVGVTGIALTKLDGTAKGGIVANITRDLQIPIRFIGIGEKIEDLQDFDPDEFIEALFQENQ
jgi:fused signal recognition particle receptor